MPVSQLVKKKDLNKRRLFEDDSSRNSFGMDEDSNMSNISNASDSQDGSTQNSVQTQEKEGDRFCSLEWIGQIPVPSFFFNVGSGTDCDQMCRRSLLT